MSMNQLLIPEKLKIGFVKRSDTYTGMLAFVTFYGKDGQLRQPKAWENWRDKSVDPVEYDNVPTEGFVLNKKVGGAKESWGWHVRQEKVRVYDPRGFEFEISVPNLLFILRECDCSRGKGLEGKFVYAWATSTSSVSLMPMCSEEYKLCNQFTTLQGKSVKSKELILGAAYITKKQELLTYLGKLDKFMPVDVETPRSDYYGRTYKPKKPCPVIKVHVFWDVKKEDFVFLKELKIIATLQSDTVAPNYAELVDKYHASIYGTKPVRLFTKPCKTPKPQRYNYHDQYWIHQESDGVFLQCASDTEWKKPENVLCTRTSHKVYIKDGVLMFEDHNKSTYPTVAARDQARRDHKRSYSWQYGNSAVTATENAHVLDDFIAPTIDRLWVELESGAKYRVGYNEIIRPPTKEELEDGEED